MEEAYKTVRKNCQKLIDEIDTLMENNDKAIMQKITEDKELEARVKRIAKTKGLGVTTVVCIVAETEGFHLIENRKQLTSYAGLDVRAKQSGREDPKHAIYKKGTLTYVQHSTCQPLVAVRYNPQIKTVYGRICQKHPKQRRLA
jgi:Transposase IS116/IS110/IS902 family.